MILATARIGIKDPDLLDITVKSSNIFEGQLLAPTWDMVAGSKLWKAQHAPDDTVANLHDWFSGAKPLSWDEYTEQYLHLLRFRYNSNRMGFLSIIKADRRVLGCYCTDVQCCHRTLAAEALVKIAGHFKIEVDFIGDLTPKMEQLL